MSLFAEFHVPSEAFALHETLQAVPEAVIEIERVVATEDILTPFFWASGPTARPWRRPSTTTRRSGT